MDNNDIQETATRFFEKYKKTEGDRTLWSAPWKIYKNGRTFEMLKLRTMNADADGQKEKLRHLNEMSGPVLRLSPHVDAVADDVAVLARVLAASVYY